MRAQIVLLVLLVSLGCASTPERYDLTQQEQIRQGIRHVLTSRYTIVKGQPLQAAPLVQRFYQRYHYQPAWGNSAKRRHQNLNALLQVIRQADSEGLDSEDYHRSALEEALQKSQKQKGAAIGHLAHLDILLSDAFLAYASDISRGRLRVKGRRIYWQHRAQELDPVPFLERAVRSKKGIKKTLRSLAPRQAGYLRLKKVLKSYQAIAARGGWPWIPSGPKLHLGDSDERISLIRQRLLTTKDLKQNSSSPYFDDALERAIRYFQHRHGLTVDGTIGKDTLAALNVSVEQRIRQIKINMERLRWLPAEMGKDYVFVNIPNYRLDYIENNHRLFSMNVVVGKRSRDWRTPALSSQINRLILNPKWNVPPGIFKKEMLAQIQKNPDYLKKKNMKVLQGVGRRKKVVSADNIDWSQVSPTHPNLRIIQSSGPGNALGRIKFLFSNPFLIYLHDTPSKRLFKRPRRAFSHGCVRIENPMELANSLFKNDPEWDRDKIQKAINTGKNQAIYLSKPVDLHILYWTAWVDEDGMTQFRNDIYGRDKSLSRALNI